VENFGGIGQCRDFGCLLDPWRALAGGNIKWLGETKDQAAAFFEANDGGGLVCWSTSRISELTGVSTHEKAGGLHWKVRAGEVDGIEGQAEISTVAFEIGGAGGLHASGD